MTREECIDTLKGIKSYYTNERDFSYYGEEYEPLGEGDNEAIDMAIEALEQEATDCISRKEAISRIEEYIEEYDYTAPDGTHDLKWCAMMEAKMVLEELSPVQPVQRPHPVKPATDSEDCISRKDFKEFLRNVCYDDRTPWGKAQKAYIDCFETLIDHMPSVQPITTSEDCISRQAVMECFNGNIVGVNNRFDVENLKSYLDAVVERIKALPSVQPKHGEWYKPKTTVRPFGEDTIQCSECGFLTDIDSNYNYCPKCGSRMDSRFERGEI